MNDKLERLFASFISIAVLISLVLNIISYRKCENTSKVEEILQESSNMEEVNNIDSLYFVDLEINEVWKVSSTGMTYVDCSLDHIIQDYAFYMCQKYGLEFEMIMAQMKVESDYQIDLISETNDYGLMQINIQNHEWLSVELGITDFLDPYQSIKAGTYVMSLMLDRCNGDYDKALASYNMGYSRANYLWGKGETETNYTKKVHEEYLKIKGI